MKGLYEILTEKKWMISPDFVHGIRKALEQNLNAHAVYERTAPTCGFVTVNAADGSIYYPEEYQISEDGKQVRGQWALDSSNDDAQNFPFVSVLTIDGPITRNGGGCSYGSIDHRNMMIKAANHPLCRGHIFIINTPGGSAWAKNDYEQAINYASSQGQPVIAFVDGMCASAGMYLASLCDERYYMHPKDEIGCIGVMASFYTQADGSKNQFTDETYHELYDPESFDKNREFRDIANDGDSEKLVKELGELGVEFRADVKKACPAAKDEHLHGKVFDAEEVKGILMDAQSDFFSCVKRCFALYNGTAEPIVRKPSDDEDETKGSLNEPSDHPAHDPQLEPDKASSAKKKNHQHTIHQKSINMANYPKINAACGMQDGQQIEVKEEGAFMNAPLLDTLEAHLTAQEQAVADAKQKATTAEQSLADLQAKHDALAETIAKKDDEIKNLKEAKAKADEDIKDLNDAKAKADEEKAKVDEELKTAQASLATAQQTIADKDAQIAELNENPGEEPAQGAAPQNNGEGAQVETAKTGYPTWNPADPVGSKKAIEEYKRENGLL
ncbi:S49 family peptidase [Prevotella sp.]|uniref:S49 family peptidase n=1 Tax=Prevotella sp. TaxID=59823 RepID=UPI003AF5CFB7